MSDQQKSEVQNLSAPSEAAAGLDAAPPASEVGHVAQGEPKTYDGDSSAVDLTDDGEGYPTEGGRDADADRGGPVR